MILKKLTKKELKSLKSDVELINHLFDLYQVNNVYKFADETFTTKKFLNLKSSYDNEPNCNVIDVYHDIFEKKNSGSVDDKYEILTLSSDVYLKFINTGYLLDKAMIVRAVTKTEDGYSDTIDRTYFVTNEGLSKYLETSAFNSSFISCEIFFPSIMTMPLFYCYSSA